MLDYADADAASSKGLAYAALNAEFGQLAQKVADKYGVANYRFAGNLVDTH